MLSRSGPVAPILRPANGHLENGVTNGNLTNGHTISVDEQDLIHRLEAAADQM